MDELVKLRLHEQLLLQELELVRSKINYVSLLTGTEQQKVLSIPSQVETSQKIETIPEQTATGKESTNPLKAVALPKSKTEVQTSLTLVTPSDLNLRPNGGIQVPIKSKEQSLVLSQERFKSIQSSKGYFVVYTGPNPGIYTSWEIAEKAVKNVSNVKYKKFKTFLEAKVSADLFTRENFKTPLELICSSDGLKPSFSQALTTPKKNSKIVLGNLKPVLTIEEDLFGSDYFGFKYLYSLGREATEKNFVEDKFFTQDKKNLSYFSFYQNANPEMVYEAYQYGLLSLVYPASNLLEISQFSKDFRNAVKNFRVKCVKGSEQEIFIKVQSTIPFWDENDNTIQAYRYVQIGIVKDKIYSPSKSMKATLEKEDLKEIAVQKLLVLINKMFSINKEDKIKINLVTDKCLITSYSHKGLSEDDFSKLQEFRRQLVSPYVFGSHYSSLCTKVKKELEKHRINYQCEKCFSIKSLVEDKEVPTTSKSNKGKAIVEE